MTCKYVVNYQVSRQKIFAQEPFKNQLPRWILTRLTAPHPMHIDHAYPITLQMCHCPSKDVSPYEYNLNVGHPYLCTDSKKSENTLLLE